MKHFRFTCAYFSNRTTSMKNWYMGQSVEYLCSDANGPKISKNIWQLFWKLDAEFLSLWTPCRPMPEEISTPKSKMFLIITIKQPDSVIHASIQSSDANVGNGGQWRRKCTPTRCQRLLQALNCTPTVVGDVGATLQSGWVVSELNKWSETEILKN